MINPYKKNAKLVLSNGIVFPGFAFGDSGTTVGEIVFNTGMTGYQEVITDPSYYGQILTFIIQRLVIQVLILMIQNLILMLKV